MHHFLQQEVCVPGLVFVRWVTDAVQAPSLFPSCALPSSAHWGFISKPLHGCKMTSEALFPCLSLSLSIIEEKIAQMPLLPRQTPSYVSSDGDTWNPYKEG